jgi:hypothetical protein
MHKSISRISSVVFTGVIALVNTSCGVDKVTQCNSIAKITDKPQSVANYVSELAKSQSTDTNKINNAFANLSATLRESSKNIQVLVIQDEKLKSFQSRSVKMYLDYAQAVDVMSSAFKSQDQSRYDKATVDVNDIVTKQKNLANEFNGYCSNK